MNANNLISLVSPKGDKLREITDENGSLWFVAKDICLGLGLSNTSQACSALDPDEKGVISLSDSHGVQQQTLIVSEPGLYRLIGKSTKPEAEVFKRWLFHKVLPAIRRTGSYSVQQQPQLSPRALGIIAEFDRQLQASEEQNQTLLIANDNLNGQVAAWQDYGQKVKPYVDHSVEIQKSESLFTSEEVAKDPRIGLPSAFALHKLLEEMGIIFSRSKKRKKWQLYAEHTDKGWHGYKTYKRTVEDPETGAPVVETHKHLRWKEKFIFVLPGLIAKHNLKIAEGKA